MTVIDPELSYSSINLGNLAMIAGRLTLDADYSNTEANTATGWDSGAAGRTVQLMDIAGNILATTTTDSTGSYRFTVPEGQYVIKFPTLGGYKYAAMDQGSVAHADSDAGADGTTDVISVSAGQVFDNIDASIQTLPVGWIKGRLTFDADGNNEEWAGNAGALDAGVAGRVVQLVDLDGNVIQSKTTDSAGNYWFEAGAGEYRVKFAAANNEGFVVQNSVGSSWLSDSEADANGLTDVISVVAGQTVSNTDAGVRTVNNGSIQGRFFMDENGNALDDGEAGVADASVQLWAWDAAKCC